MRGVPWTTTVAASFQSRSGMKPPGAPRCLFLPASNVVVVVFAFGFLEDNWSKRVASNVRVIDLP